MAAEPTPGRWTSHAALANAISNVTVSASIVNGIWDDFRSPTAPEDFACDGLRLLAAYGVPAITKRIWPRLRPDGTPQGGVSQHSAVGFSMAGQPRAELSYVLAVSTDYLRVAAGKHRWSEVLTGGLIGVGADYAVSKIPGCEK